MATLYNGADASRPGNPLPRGTQIVFGYVGAPDLPGQPDTPHIWTRDEWNLYMDPQGPFHVRGLRCIPTYVHNFVGDPADDAANAVDAVTDLGWKPGIGRIINVDIETQVMPAWVRAMNRAISKAGFRMMLYGSNHFVIQNPAPAAGYHVALLTSRRPRVLPAVPDGVHAQQWHFGSRWDLDVCDQFTYDNAGRGPRRRRP